MKNYRLVNIENGFAAAGHKTYLSSWASIYSTVASRIEANKHRGKSDSIAHWLSSRTHGFESDRRDYIKLLTNATSISTEFLIILNAATAVNQQ